MSCISSNFSSFFLNSLNDPSEFSKYLSNGELRLTSTFEDFPGYQQQQQQFQQQHYINGTVGVLHANGSELDDGNSNIENTQPMITSIHQYTNYQTPNQQPQFLQQQQRWINPQQQQIHVVNQQNPAATSVPVGPTSATSTGNFDGSFEFMKYLRHSNDYTDTNPESQNSNASNTSIAIGTKPEASINAANASIMDLDNAHKRSAARKTPILSSASSNHASSTASSNSHPTPMAIDIYDHDSKHMIYDLHHMNSIHNSNSNESSMELSSMTYPNSHLNASNSNTSSEGGTNAGQNDFSMLSVSNANNSQSATASNAAAAAATASPAAPKPLAAFTIKENFDAHPSHKVEEGIFQHMNKLPSKKKETLKQLGVRFTGQMTLNDKSIIVENFIKFCQEYDINDHRPFLSLNQSGLNKPDQIKFARYLGQGLPTFTLFCIYSNFKNLFCTKRTEIYTKDGYNLPYILDKTKRFLANTTAGTTNNNNNATNTNSTSSSSSNNTNNTTNTSTTASSSNINSLNTNNTLKNTPATAATAAGNSNNAATAIIQNGNSSSNSNCSTVEGGGNGNGNENFNNDIINTPTKQIHNVPSPATPRTPQIQQMPQIPIQTQNTPLPAHPPQHPHPPPHNPNLNNIHHQQQQQHHPPTPHLPTQQQQQHIMQMPMSPMVAVSANIIAPSNVLGSPLPPSVATTTGAPPPAAASAIIQSTTNHHQHPIQHPHHMQPNNHLTPHHPPLTHHHHHHVHPTTPLVQQHPDHAAAYQQQQQIQHPHQHQPPQQQQQQQQPHQTHHPLHNLAAQNPPL